MLFNTSTIHKLFVIATILCLLGFQGCTFISGSQKEETTEENDLNQTETTPDESEDTTPEASLKSGDSAKKEEEEETKVPVKIQPIETGEISDFITTTSTLKAEKQVSVISKGTGQVLRVNYDVGDTVREGTILASLEKEELRINRKIAETQVNQLSEKLDKLEQLYKEQIISEEAYNDVKYQLQNAKANLDLTELTLRNADIRAPISGVISQRLIQKGMTISLATPTFVIVDLDSLVAEVHVPEKDGVRLREGQQSLLSTDAFPDLEFTGQIISTSPVVDPVSGTVTVKIGFEEKDVRLKPGMFVRVKIITETHENAVLIPKKAILYEADEMHVFIIEDKKAKRVEITPGLDNNLYQEVTEGLEPGQNLVVIGQRGLKDGAMVEIIED